MVLRLALCTALLGATLLSVMSLNVSGAEGRASMSESVVTRAVPVHGPLQVPLEDRPPVLTAEQQDLIERHGQRDLLPDKSLAAGDPVSTLSSLDVSQTSLIPSAQSEPAPRSTSINLSSTNLSSVIPSSYRSIVNEPTAANAGTGNLVFYTGNWYAALSKDGGSTFSYINPYNAFSKPRSDESFCCDQVAIHDSSRDLMFWLLLYGPNGTNTHSTMRLAVARGQSQLAANSWIYLDFEGSDFGYSSYWLDYPQLALSNNNLYLTTNMYDSSNSWRASGFYRMPLDELASSNSVNIDTYVQSTVGTLSPVQGATSTMYFGSHKSTSSIRVLRLAEGSPTVYWDDVSVTTWPNSTRRCAGPDGRDWCGRADHRITGAWSGGGTLGFMWSASQGTTGGSARSYPYVHVARINASNRSLIDQPQMWNSSYAYIYPAAGINGLGYLGGAVFAGGGSLYPTSSVFIWDNVSSTPPPWEVHTVASSTSGPTSNKWGDYLSVRPSSSSTKEWIATGYYLTDSIQPLYVRFSRAASGNLPHSATFQKVYKNSTP